MQPYYQDDAVTIYHGDCRDILPLLEPVDRIITDPVWPNASKDLIGSADPFGLFASAASEFPRLASTLVVHLGGFSDVRFLSCVPAELPFMRVCWMRYALPNYVGRFLGQADVAYVFGLAVPPRIGMQIIPAEITATDSHGKETAHPTPRKMTHVRWLVKWFSAEKETVLDPFMGSGTTLRAAKDLGRKAIGIEIEEKYAEIAAKRMAQGVLL